MSENVDLLVHITHEAGVKLGGIGAVLDGLLGSQAYNQNVERSLIIGPLDTENPGEMERLYSPKNNLRLRYAASLGINTLSPSMGEGFQAIEAFYNVQIYYGDRPFQGIRHEVLLVDVNQIDLAKVNGFKYYLWDSFGLDCGRYEFDSEFTRFVHLAEPAYGALYFLAQGVIGNKVILAHEWMGVPFVMAAQMKDPLMWHTFFYAHEVATARLLIEEYEGHDTRFYNAMRAARAQGMSMDDVFGDQDYYYKHALLKRAVVCDGILAVGDLVVEELRFLGGAFEKKRIDLVYNGVPSAPLSLAEKKRSKALLQDYADNLLGFKPDYVFSHVTRFVVSKGMWRDLRVLQHLENEFAAAGKRAVLFVLSSYEPTGRNPAQVFSWEEAYGWPVGHRTDNGDLLGLESHYFYHSLQPFNHQSQAIQAVLVNQFGWSRDRCGQRMSADMNFMDLRRGADLEFGQSVYEPFGIAQVEPLSFGALCVVSNVCGCVGFVKRSTRDRTTFPNLIVADYVTTPPDWQFTTPYDALRLDQYGRDLIEIANSRRVAEKVAAHLPSDDDQTQQLLDQGQEVGSRMSWEVVVESYLLPALYRVLQTE